MPNLLTSFNNGSSLGYPSGKTSLSPATSPRKDRAGTDGSLQLIIMKHYVL